MIERAGNNAALNGHRRQRPSASFSCARAQAQSAPSSGSELRPGGTGEAGAGAEAAMRLSPAPRLLRWERRVFVFPPENGRGRTASDS